MDTTEGRADSNQAAATDELLTQIVDYVLAPPKFSDEAHATAALCLLDSIGCALEALEHPQCVAHLGPLVPGGEMATGARVIGTGERLDPVKAAFDNGALLRWLDFNDTWLAAEWGHPSDNFAGLLGLADYMCRNPGALGTDRPVTVEQLLELAIQAYEIQGVLALANSFNRVGLDHVLLVKVATAAVAAKLAGGGASEITSAVSHAWIDGQSLRTYRHAPNTSQRKSWAAGDAASRGVRLALMAVRSGLPALPSALSAPQWGFADVLFNSRLPVLERELGCYVMENILFKVAYPAEFHSQTAVECAVELHPQVSGRLGQIDKIQIRTQEAAVRIISKTGPLRNYADRDHCIQYMVAVGLLEGDLRAEHYADAYAQNPQIDQLRERTVVQEDKRYSADYLDPDKRSIANAVKVWFADGSSPPEVEVEYPLGHRRRRDQARPLLLDKYRGQAGCLDQARRDRIEQLLAGRQGLAETTVAELVEMTCR